VLTCRNNPQATHQ